MRTYPPAKGQRVAIVTGASQGIGYECALRLALEGWKVLISGRRIDALQASVAQIEQAINEVETPKGSKGGVRLFAGDMAKEKDIIAMFAEAKEQFGQVDLVFINAGRSSPPTPIQQLELSEWQAMVDVNLTGAWLCAREAFRYMSGDQDNEPGGRIILNGSISAHTPRPFSSPCELHVLLSYGTSHHSRLTASSRADTSTKHAITGLTKSLSLDGRRYNIAVSQIDIGNAATSMTSRMSDGVLQADGETRRPEPTFDVAWVGREVAHIASMPLDCNVQFTTIQATNMPSMIGRG